MGILWWEMQLNFKDIIMLEVPNLATPFYFFYELT